MAMQAHRCGAEVSLWTRRQAHAQAMLESGLNQSYLPGVSLPADLKVTSDIEAALGSAPDLIVLASPMAGLRSLAQVLAKRPDLDAVPRVWLSKGIEPHTLLLPEQVLREVQPAARLGALLGPSFALEVGRGLPAALTIASADEALRDLVTQAFHGAALRVYGSTDMTGAQLGGALKNVVAIATGVSDGLALGLNARAALMTRGLAEIARLGAAMGADPRTFMGLTGMGDLVLTCTGELSRNRRVGLELAAGHSLEQILARLGHVAEGVACVEAAVALGRRLNVDLPIVQVVAQLLSQAITPREALELLVTRAPTKEK
jgi:glycerol-3-phosphate dehydrogenase (NAD(P)+)